MTYNDSEFATDNRFAHERLRAYDVGEGPYAGEQGAQKYWTDRDIKTRNWKAALGHDPECPQLSSKRGLIGHFARAAVEVEPVSEPINSTHVPHELTDTALPVDPDQQSPS